MTEMQLGLDLGTNSLGWTLYRLDAMGKPCAIEALGVRIFSDGRDPNSKESLAVERRAARSMRRRRDRYLQRRDALFAALVHHGLMPVDRAAAVRLKGENPYDLRVAALREPLSPHGLGRALFHLNQRRGFKSNRRADRRRDAKEDGKVKSAEIALDRAMAEADCDTLGQFLHARATKRVRMMADGSGYEFYPQRRHYEHEFDRIWAEQAKHHPELLTGDARRHIRGIIFRQRDLKAARVGKCTFLEEERLPKAHPLFQQRRLYEEVNQLRIRADGRERSLTRDERDKLIHALKAKRTVSFKTLRTRVLKLDEDARFNKESDKRRELAGDEIAAEMSHKTRFGTRWTHLDMAQRWAVIERVLNEPDPDVLTAWLATEHGLGKDVAEAVAAAHLPEGHGRLGETASRLILAALEADVIDYDEAVARNVEILGHHSHRGVEDVHDLLPYYGEILDRDLKPGTSDPADPDDVRYGRVSNPTVHIGLNQLRRVVNEIIAKHGKPDRIILEMARELKQTDRQRKHDEAEQAASTRQAEARSRILREHGIPDTGANRMRLRLWQENAPANVTDRFCPYCGTLGGLIGIRQLFHSGEVDVDHILPYSRTLDDTPANKVVVHAACNRQKGNMTPHEKWGSDPARWNAILDQVGRLHSGKQWRFLPNAMERFEKDDGFAARQLVDTQYLSVLAGRYLTSLYGKRTEEAAGDKRRVFVIPGRLTAMLRRIWSLNALLSDHNKVENIHSAAEKNRLDHRHHVIDSAIAGVTTNSLIHQISSVAAQAEREHLERLFADLKTPWCTFRDDLQKALGQVVVSHRPDHGLKPKASLKQAGPPHMTAGQLHNDTAYGFTGQTSPSGLPLVVHRVQIASLKPEHLVEGGQGRKRAWIADRTLRDALAAATAGKTEKTAFAEAVRRFALTDAKFLNMRAARVIEAMTVVPIRDAEGRAYKGYKGDSNYRYDVWELPDGKWVTGWKDAEGRVRSSIVSMFDAHRPGAEARPHPAARKVLSLYRDDILAIERGGDTRELFRVVKFSPEQLALAPLHEANVDKRNRGKDYVGTPMEFKYTFPAPSRLKEWRARQVIVSETGAVRDPGFPARTRRRPTRAKAAE